MWENVCHCMCNGSSVYVLIPFQILGLVPDRTYTKQIFFYIIVVMLAVVNASLTFAFLSWIDINTNLSGHVTSQQKFLSSLLADSADNNKLSLTGRHYCALSWEETLCPQNSGWTWNKCMLRCTRLWWWCELKLWVSVVHWQHSDHEAGSVQVGF